MVGNAHPTFGIGTEAVILVDHGADHPPGSPGGFDFFTSPKPGVSLDRS